MGFLKFKTGMGPLQLLKVQQGGFQTDPQILQALATGGQPLGRWKEGLMFDPLEKEVEGAGNGVAPMPWLKSAANWFPGTEEVQREEIRVTFMGSSPLPRPGQMGANDIYFPHLHWDHVDSVAYACMVGAWSGRRHENFRITGPSGRDEQRGAKYMMAKMDEMPVFIPESKVSDSMKPKKK